MKIPLALLWIAVLSSPVFSSPHPGNLLANLSATFDPAPNYTPCTDSGDHLQLTDGVTSSGKGMLWVEREAVGWVHPRQPILISFDLGSEKPIGSVSIRSAAGHAGVYWPQAMGLFLSDDGKRWSYAGEIISQSIAHGLPEPMSYSEHRFTINNVAARARYVAFCILRGGSGFFISDEIEITEGESTGKPRQLPVVGDLAAVREYLQKDQTANMILRRLELDSSRLRKKVEGSPLPAADKEAFLAELRQLTESNRHQTPEVSDHFRTVIPINTAQEHLLSLHGRVLKKQGYPRLFLTKTHRYSYLGWLETPELTEQQPIHLEYRQMLGETRADLFQATNAAAAPAEITFQLDAPADAVQVFHCPWTDTPQLEPVATALLPAKKMDGGWRFSIPAGATTKVWVSVDGSRLPPGTHHFQGIVKNDKSQPIPVSLNAEISSVKIETPDLHLGMWDELNGKGRYGITPENTASAIRLMRSHGVDSPWATPSVLPMPKKSDFDADERLLPGKPDFSPFDAWLKQWPDARRYMVFLNVPAHIGGVPMDSPRFAPRVEQWAAAAWKHLASRGLKPGQVFLLLVDEPKSDEQDSRLLAWAEPIKKAAPELMVWSDPVRKNPEESAFPSAFEIPDVLCPNAGTLAKGGPRTVDYYRQKAAQGKPLETYACSALAPHSDPNRYFRMLPWIGWPLRVQGVGYWSFGDTGGLADCWNAYGKANGIWYTPAFIGKTDVTDTLHWQAVREGLLDHQYLNVLERALPGITDPTLRKEAQELLSDKAVQALLNGWTHTESAAWKSAKGADAPDLHRQKILTLLEKLPTRR